MRRTKRARLGDCFHCYSPHANVLVAPRIPPPNSPLPRLSHRLSGSGLGSLREPSCVYDAQPTPSVAWGMSLANWPITSMEYEEGFDPHRPSSRLYVMSPLWS